MEDEKQKRLNPAIVVPVSATSASSRAAAKAQEAASHRAKAQQRMLFVLLGAAIALNVVIAAALYRPMIVQATQHNIDGLIDTELSSSVAVASKFIKTQQEKVNAIAANTAVVQAVQDNSVDAKDVLTATFAKDFDNFLDLKLIPLGMADIDSASAVPISYAELDQIRRSERGEKAYPELIKLGDKLVVHLVSPVRAAKDSPIMGTLFITLGAESLRKGFASTNHELGEKALVQRFANAQPFYALKFGTAAVETSDERPIERSNWLVQFKVGQSLLDQAKEEPTLWILAVCASCGLSLVLALLLSRYLVSRAQRSEASLAPTLAEVKQAVTDAIPDSNELPNSASAAPILDIEVAQGDEDILGLGDTSQKKQSAQLNLPEESKVPAHIFRSYDVRGVVGKDLTPGLAELIGQAIGTEALDAGEHSLLVGRDGRTHSDLLSERLVKGILSTGCNVINLRLVPTPVLYYATYHFDDVHSGVMVTASHNPAEYNGFKVVINNHALADHEILKLRERILTGRVHKGVGEETYREIIPQYIDRIFSDVALAGDVKLVIDAGNAVPGIVAPRLFEELGCEVVPLYCDIDGHFPHHEPDPTQEHNLISLIEKVKEENADMGVAFDGDGDRLVVVTPRGEIIWPDRMLMVFAKDILARHPGADVLFDVKCTRQLNQVISGYGGRPIMWKTGHSPMKSKMVETGALIGGEYSGHIFIKDRWYGFDDGLYAMARLLEIITLRDQPIDEIFDAFPPLVITPEIKINVDDDRKFALIQQLAEQGDFQNGNMTTIDGIRVDYSKGWGLVRASNTSPALTLRFEAETEDALTFIKQVFKRELQKIDNSLTLNF